MTFLSIGGIASGAAPNSTHASARRRLPALTCTVDGVTGGDWDRVVAQFADAHPDQTSCFAAKPWNAQESHILLADGGAPVAGARLAILTLPGFKQGLAYLKFGPFWRRRDRAADIENYRAAIAAIVDEYCARRGHCVSIMPRPNPEFYTPESDVLAEMGFAVRRKFSDANRYLVDLSLDEEAQLRSLDQKWRYNLRQALANNIDIRVCESEADLETFRLLYESMVERKNFSSPPSDHLRGAANGEIAPHLRPLLVMGFCEQRPVVGATVGVFGDTAYYMFGASTAEALALKAGYALQWWIVRRLSEQRVARWYDLGGEVGEQGLRQFKKGFAGKRGAVVVMQGEHDRWTSLPGRIAADVIYGLRAAQRTIRDWR